MKCIRNTVIVFLLILPMFSSAMDQQQRQEQAEQEQRQGQGRDVPDWFEQFEIAFLRAFLTTLNMNVLGRVLQWSDSTTSISSGVVPYLYNALVSPHTIPMVLGNASGVALAGSTAYILRHLNNEPSQGECQIYLVENTDR